MEYLLSPEQIEALPPQAYWLNNTESPVTNQSHLAVLKDLGLSINEDLYTLVANWEQDFSYKIYQYLDSPVDNPHKLPKNIFFPEQLNCNLFKDYVLYYGDRVLTIYYQGYNTATEALSNPLVKISYVYHRDSNHYLKYIDRTFHWMLNNGNWSTETYSDTQPFTNPSHKAKELAVVRSNIIEEAQGFAKLLGLTSQMLQIYTTFAAEVSLYEKVGSPALSLAVANAGEGFEWLEYKTPDNVTTLRAFLSYFFSIGTLS